MRLKTRIWSWTLASFIRIYFHTCRIEVHGLDTEQRLLEKNKRLLWAGWHRGVIYNAYNFRDKKAGLMVSQSKDGHIIASVMHHLNFYNPRGSSSKGGASALDKMIEYINNGNVGGLSPDGPRGPGYKAKPGIIQLAARTGAPLLLYACDASPCYEFNTWDRTFLPYPFSRIVVIYSREPMYIDNNLSTKEYDRLLKEFDSRLNTLTYQARYYVKNHLRGSDPRDIVVPDNYMDYLPRKIIGK
ncbi:MAG: lysophospholipid acyltransferase family protein [Thermodesulfobacteriota bacterium]|nr:lysophospholipid acyltransferase family protein [Thermodesulfobacteriota bacterium]